MIKTSGAFETASGVEGVDPIALLTAFCYNGIYIERIVETED